MAKKALLVGLNRYPDPAVNLNGCVNDVLQTSEVLQEHFGFSDARNIRLLTDARATTAAIVARLKWLVDDARAGDTLFFHYSGHGSQVLDRDGDELDDGMDEIICPYDLNWDDPFTDDDMSAILDGLKQGVSCTILLDCCHSGTGLRDFMPNGTYAKPRCVPAPPSMRAPKRDVALRRFGRNAAQRGAVLLAACRADQSCADAFIDGDYHGAFTYFLWQSAARRSFRVSYRELIAAAAVELGKAGYEQVPQLEGPEALLSQSLLAPLVETAV